nr:MAG TPA: Pre-mRNA-splicing factor 8, Pre-mRNA-splicing factor-mRNA splicing, spliceosome, post-catalytic, P [Caudoviricetes sp.]
MVQRYEVEKWGLPEPEVVEYAYGDYVRYEDYAKLEAELQKYKDQFPDYVECANCGSITHVEGVE